MESNSIVSSALAAAAAAAAVAAAATATSVESVESIESASASASDGGGDTSGDVVSTLSSALHDGDTSGSSGIESLETETETESSSMAMTIAAATAAMAASTTGVAATTTTAAGTMSAATPAAAASSYGEPKKRAYQTRQLDYKQKKAICLKKQSSPGMTQEALRLWAQAEFTLLKPPGQSTISDILKNADAILALDARALENKRVRSVTYPELDTALANWVLQCEARNVKIYNELIKAQAAVLCELLGIAPNAIRFSGGWLESFKDRHGFNAFTVFGRANKNNSGAGASYSSLTSSSSSSSYGANHVGSAAMSGKALGMDAAATSAMLADASGLGLLLPGASTPSGMSLAGESAAASPVMVPGVGDEAGSGHGHIALDDRLETIRARIAAFAPCDVYAMQETALVYKLEAETETETEARGPSPPRSRVTVVLCANADASDRREPLVIGRERQPASFGDKAPAHYGFYYRSNKHAWMTGLLFRDWVIRFNSAMLAAGRRVLLLLDAATSHVVTGLELTNVYVQFLPLGVRSAAASLSAAAAAGVAAGVTASAAHAAGASTTTTLHPLDVGATRMFKLQYRSLLLQHALEQAEEVQRWTHSATDGSVRRPLQPSTASVLHISQLTAMRWIRSAWQDVPADAVVHGFQLQRLVSERLKTRQSVPQLERELEASVLYKLDDLRAHDALVDAAVLAADEAERAGPVHQTFNPEDFVDQLTPDEEAAARHAADDSAGGVLASYSVAEKLDRVRTVLLMLSDFAGADAHTIATLRSLQTHLRSQVSYDML